MSGDVNRGGYRFLPKTIPGILHLSIFGHHFLVWKPDFLTRGDGSIAGTPKKERGQTGDITVNLYRFRIVAWAAAVIYQLHLPWA